MKFTGTAVSEGVVIGKVYLYQRFPPQYHVLRPKIPTENWHIMRMPAEQHSRNSVSCVIVLQPSRMPKNPPFFLHIWKFWLTRQWMRKFG